MNTLSLEEKKILVLDNEEALARQMALQVLDKPSPPIWMIFIPVFFVFFAQKMNQYKKGLQDFAEHYMISRRWALDAARDAVASGAELAVDEILTRVKDIPEAARPAYRQWLQLQGEHYRQLLAAPGNSYPALVRAGYRNKANYLLICDRLGKAEDALNRALLPDMEGQHQDVRQIIETMAQASMRLRRQDIEGVFS
jgi:hypothetical protein